jgi:hypothetical protein
MPKYIVDFEIGDKWDVENKSYSSFNIAYPAQKIRLDGEQHEHPLEVKVGMGINLNPAVSVWQLRLFESDPSPQGLGETSSANIFRESPSNIGLGLGFNI